MLELIFFPIRLAMEIAMFPFRLFIGLLRSGWLITIWVIMGLASLIGGLIRGMLPLILIGIGLTLIAGAYKSAREKKAGVQSASFENAEPFRSFYADGRVE